MGQFFTRLHEILSSFTETSSARILMVGLDAAGKTTILYKLKLNETVQTIPTIGFNVETVTPAPGITFTIWDVGGPLRIQPLRSHYYDGCDGLLFVVDAADLDRFNEARDELFSVMTHASMSSVPVVVIANKSDLPMAASTTDLITSLNLHSLSKRRWYVQRACALTADGLIEATQQLAKMIKDNGSKLS